MAIVQTSYSVSSEVQGVYDQLTSSEQVRQALDFLRSDADATLADQKIITEIPAPPFQEQERAAYYLQRLTELGLQDAAMDSEGNVMGVYKGRGVGPTVFVSAHLDTVFPAGTAISVTEKNGRLYAPGISDDARGLATILSVIRALRAAGIETAGDIVFGGDVGEEGLGDLRGVKAFFRDNPDIDGFITVDGTSHGIITYLATGSRRFEVTYQGSGGHSFKEFGIPSAIHALGRAIAKIAELTVPQQPKTTFTVGTITGGTSVNSIAAMASMLVDMRSDSPEELRKLEEALLVLVREANDEENARWNSQELTVELKLVGDRPAGQQSVDAPIVQAAYAATVALGETPELSPASSTDANLPLSLGIPSLRLGGGGVDGKNHSPEEWFDPTNAYLGPQKVLLTLLGLVGLAGGPQPLLSVRKKR